MTGFDLPDGFAFATTRHGSKVHLVEAGGEYDTLCGAETWWPWEFTVPERDVCASCRRALPEEGEEEA